MSLNSIDPIEFQVPQNMGLPAQAEFREHPGQRVRVVGRADGQETLLASTNGEPHVLRWPRNAGTTNLYIYCVDRQWIYVDNTVLNLPVGAQLESYTSPKGAYRILFYGEKSEDSSTEGRTELEMDR
jgi:hypothetical protein